MMLAGLRPYRLAPLDRGCVNEIVFLAQKKDGSWIDKTSKKLYLTAKTAPWDDVADDSDAVFKVDGVLPDTANEPGRVVFTISAKQSYLDPTVPYFCDIVEVDGETGENPRRLFIGEFNVTPGANNAQAGGEQ